MKRNHARLVGRRVLPALAAVAVALALSSAPTTRGDDWPQFRGPHSNNKVTGFTVPDAWPKTFTQKWKVKVGEGLASPALVGDKIYTFTRVGNDEVITCLEADTGKEVWKDKYAAEAVTGPAGGFPGPRSSPAVGEGKVCTFGVGGVVSCVDAATGTLVWRKETKGRPQFYTSQSPVIADGKCILDVGGPEARGGKGGKGGAGGGKGELTAFDLATGEAKWKLDGEAPSYGSPVVANIGDVKQIVVLTSANLIGVGLANGKLLWSVPFNQGRYQTATPVISGNTVICSGTAFTIEKAGDKFTVKEAWKGQAPHQYNTPVLKDGVIYGYMGMGRTTNIYAQDAKTGKTLWDVSPSAGECGSILDAGPVLIGLSSDMNLVVFKPDKAEFKEVAKYKVADTPTWAMPILAGKRIYVKDRDSLILWTIE